MRRRSFIINLLLIVTFIVSLYGDGLIVLCVDVHSGHAAFERSTDACPSKVDEVDCGDDQLHYDDPLNHSDDVNSCTDTLIELSEFNSQRAEDNFILHNLSASTILDISPALSSTHLVRLIPPLDQRDLLSDVNAGHGTSVMLI